MPLSRIRRAEDTFKASLYSVSNSSVVGKTLKSDGRWMYMAVIITMTDIMMSTTSSRSNRKGGRGAMRAITMASTATGTASSAAPPPEKNSSGFHPVLAIAAASAIPDISRFFPYPGNRPFMSL